MEEPAGGKSGSIAINLALRSHLGPIHRRPCHLIGGLLRCRYQSRAVADFPRRPQDQGGLLVRQDKGRLDREQWTTWLGPRACVCACACNQTCMLLATGTHSISENTRMGLVPDREICLFVFLSPPMRCMSVKNLGENAVDSFIE